MALIAPPQLVSGAPRIPLAYGLFSVLAFRGGEERWINGVKWDVPTCEPIGGIAAPDCDPENVVGLPKELTGGDAAPGEASVFSVYGHFTCSPIGNTLEHAEERARMHLQNREEARVEQALWTGDLDNKPSFKTASALGTTALPVRVAIAKLEREIATNYGSQGTIHVSRDVAVLGLGRGVFETKSGRLFTKLGTPVIAGAGYGGAGPTGSAAPANSEWAVVTPAIFGYRSEIFTPSAFPGDLLDRRNNDLYGVAERSYLIGWDDCGIAAIPVTLTDSTNAA